MIVPVAFYRCWLIITRLPFSANVIMQHNVKLYWVSSPLQNKAGRGFTVLLQDTSAGAFQGWTSWRIISLQTQHTHTHTNGESINRLIWIGKRQTVHRIRHNIQLMNEWVRVKSRGLLFPSSGWMGRACSSTAVALSIWSFHKQGWNSRISASRPAGLNWLSTAYCLY